MRQWLAVLIMVCCAQNLQATLSNAFVNRVDRGVFEVLFRKIEKDSLTYEKPLPLEFLPYSVRTDDYHSIGSAFFIDGNRFITAGHVMDLNDKTQFDTIYIRDSKKRVYEVDQILSYSYRRDFVVFTVKGEVDAAPLTLNPSPSLNTTVYAVGNALGEGVVIREGILTSKTDEDLKGEWKWLRFSAAASPGNSGGPLLDEEGRVVGVILRKSPNENLNYALPVSEILASTPNMGVLDNRFVFKMPNSSKTRYDFYSHAVSLPKSVGELRKSIHEHFNTYYDRNMRRLMEENAEGIFPRGSGSEELLNTSQIEAGFPNVIVENEYGSWALFSPKDLKTIAIGNNGFLSFGSYQDILLTQLQKPDNVTVEQLYKESKRFMDLILKGTYFSREVGIEKIKVTSLGPAVSSETHRDRYGRQWLVQNWLIEYSDSRVVAVSLPTPRGRVSLIQFGKTGDDYIEWDLKMLTDFVVADFYGTFSEWQAFPFPVDSLKFKFDPKTAHLEVKGLSVDYPRSLLPISAKSILKLGFGFRKNKNGVAMEIASVSFAEDRHSGNTLSIVRTPKPEGNLSDEFFSDWRKITTKSHPYNEIAYSKAGQTFISGVLPSRGSQERLTVTLGREGQISQSRMKRLLEDVKNRFESLRDELQ